MKRAVAGLVVLAAALAAWTAFRARDAERAHPPTGRLVDVDGGAIHLVERGSGTPIVLLHGAYGGVDDWRATLLEPLAAHHRVIALDAPSQGWSRAPEHFAASPAADARVLRDAVRALGVTRPIVVGFSLGGATAMAWALDHQDELAGLVLVNAVLYPWPGATDPSYVLSSLPLVDELLARALATPIASWTLDGALDHAFAPAPVDPRLARGPIELALRPQSFVPLLREMRLLKAAVAIQSTRYAELRLPLEIVAGRGDRVTYCDFHSERLHREVPGSELVVVEGGGHQIVYSHTAEVLAAIERFAARIER